MANGMTATKFENGRLVQVPATFTRVIAERHNESGEIVINVSETADWRESGESGIDADFDTYEDAVEFVGKLTEDGDTVIDLAAPIMIDFTDGTSCTS